MIVGYTWTQTDEYTIEVGSGAMIYVPSFIKIVSGIQKLRGDTQTDSMLIA
jgi:uncharacterized RmlC-like cupin family protein